MSKDDFRAALKGRATKTRVAASAARVPGVVTALMRVLEEMREIRDLLRQGKVPGSGPATFTITERDGSGKVKSFKVENES